MNEMENRMKQKAIKINQDAPLFDLHLDTFSSDRTFEQIINGSDKGQSDIPRMLDGGYKGGLFSIFVHPRNEGNYTQVFDSIYSKFSRCESEEVEQVKWIKNFKEIDTEGKQINALLEIEGLHTLRPSLSEIERCFKLGIRVFTLTWNNSNHFATSALDAHSSKTDNGLSQIGKEAVRMINDLGAIIDLAHSSKKTFFDVLEISSTPPIVSHTGFSFGRDVFRNIDEEQVKALYSVKGIAGLYFIPEFLNREGNTQITLREISELVARFVEIAGIESCGLGSDFDGTNYLPEGISDCSDIWKLTDALLQFGFSEDDIKKMMGGNFIQLLNNAFIK